MKNYFEDIDRDAIRARAEQMLDYANGAKSCACRWTNFAMDKAHDFSIFDFAVLKVCLLSLGLWLGSCFAKLFQKCRSVLFVVFVASWLYLFWRIFFDGEE